MLKVAIFCLIAFGFFSNAALCRAQSGENSESGEGAERTLANGTNVKLIVGDTVIPAVLNESTSSKALLAKLPYTVNLQRYTHDFCGVMGEALPYDKNDVHSGWKNGDIAFAIEGNYFAILYKDEEISAQYDGMVTMGALEVSPSVMETLDGSISVRIEAE